MYHLAVVLALVTIANGLGRIVGGKNANIENHNYQVSLQLVSIHYCGATLVKPNVVVTAAHCVHKYENSPQSFTVRAGATNIRKEGEVRSVELIHKDKRFQETNTDYDVAVLILKEPFELSEKIGLAEVVPKDHHSANGKVGTVTGWGAKMEGGYNSNILQVVRVPKLDWGLCKSYYANYGFTIRMSCWGYPGGSLDACHGDSGGPLVIYSATGNPQLAGIVSWGEGCGRHNRPGVYTEVANAEINDFIMQYVDDVILKMETF